MKKNPIVIVEDNLDDCRFLTKALHITGVDNPLRCFENGETTLQYLRETTEEPLMIISDIKMPVMDGIQLKKCIMQDQRLNKKNIPFIFLSTLPPAYYHKQVKELGVQGHFQKPSDFQDMLHVTKSIVEAWIGVKQLK